MEQSVLLGHVRAGRAELRGCPARRRAGASGKRSPSRARPRASWDDQASPPSDGTHDFEYTLQERACRAARNSDTVSGLATRTDSKLMSSARMAKSSALGASGKRSPSRAGPRGEVGDFSLASDATHRCLAERGELQTRPHF